MNFRVKNEKGEVVTIPINAKLDEGYHAVYANGAMGGFLANYHYRIDFYQDMIPAVEFREKDGVQQDNIIERGVDRKIVTSVFLPLPFLKELRNWLDKNINEFESENGSIAVPARDPEKEEKEKE